MGKSSTGEAAHEELDPLKRGVEESRRWKHGEGGSGGMEGRDEGRDGGERWREEGKVKVDRREGGMGGKKGEEE